VRRRGFTVALIGPDGAGKTTVARRLAEALPLDAAYVYMGVNADAGTHVLPTTRLLRRLRRVRGTGGRQGGPREHASAVARPRSPARRAAASARAALRLAYRLAEESYLQLVVRAQVRRGRIVLSDRDFFSDYYAYDVAGPAERPLSRRIHGFVLDRLYPKPDLVVYLDAPADVLFARKGEGTLELLERRRQDYLGLADVVARFAVVDATRPLDDVVESASALVVAHADGSPA
jgi:thymidylate kinase